MLYPIKVIDIDLSEPVAELTCLDDYIFVQALIRLHGVPIGYIKVPIVDGRCDAQTIAQAIVEKHSQAIVMEHVRNALDASEPRKALALDQLFENTPGERVDKLPSVTIAVCSRDRPENVALCLDAIMRVRFESLDVLLVDNAPTTTATRDLIDKKYPWVRYVCEPRPGLDWARNRAILEARHEVIAFVDDDAIVDPDWPGALAAVFAEDSDVMAVTGLVVPYELETESQVTFERYGEGGFCRGFKRKWHRYADPVQWHQLGTAQYGVGANMAYRRSVFSHIGGFDPALDVGTATGGAGDLEMFFRVLKHKYTLVYEPTAIVRHIHRRDMEGLRKQLTGAGSVIAFYLCARQASPELRHLYVPLMLWHFRTWILARLFKSLANPGFFPPHLVLCEMRGCLKSLFSYDAAKKRAQEIERQYGAHPAISSRHEKKEDVDASAKCGITAIRFVDVKEHLQPIVDVSNYRAVLVYVLANAKPIGSFYMQNDYRPISTSQLRDQIVGELGLRLIAPELELSDDVKLSLVFDNLRVRFASVPSGLNIVPATGVNGAMPTFSCVTPAPHEQDETKMAGRLSVSVVVATRDRPADLEQCLASLLQQDCQNNVEIIVVDNNPASGLTPPVVSRFAAIKLVNEWRQGVAYARNAGVRAAGGDIIATVDDDVIVPANWLHNILSPFGRADVLAVTGNVLPLQLETRSQQLFEQYGDGGLGRGYKRWDAGHDWFANYASSVPTWLLGGTANAAFRRSIFVRSDIGMMVEYLGPGMPSGVGEDIYLFYKILKSGATVAYEPAAYLWHKHRRTMPELRRQLYNYSKGFVSYQLTTLLRDFDLRSVRTLLALPLWHWQRLYLRVTGDSQHPARLILLESLGNLVGPWALFRSILKVRFNDRRQPSIGNSVIAQSRALAISHQAESNRTAEEGVAV